MDQTRPILLLASTGFIIRNLVLGKFAEEIIKHRKLVVAVPNEDDEQLKLLLEEKGIEAIHFPLEKINNGYPIYEYKILHNYFYRLKQGQKSSKSLELQTKLWETPGGWKKQLIDKILIGSGKVLASVGLFHYFENFYLNKYTEKPITSEWVDILNQVNPSFVLSTMLSHAGRYMASFDLPPVLAARQLNIPAGTLIQSWDNLSSKVSVLPDWLEAYWTWSETMSKELYHFYPNINKHKVKVIGSPQFDFHLEKDIVEPREKFCRENGLDATKKFILVGTGTERWMPDESLKILSLVNKLKTLMPDLQVLLRLHPKDHGSRWASKRGTALWDGRVIFQFTSPHKHMDEGGFIPPRDFYKNQVNTIYHSEMVLNSSSTITVDAAILDKPIICFGYDAAYDPKFPEGRALAYTQSNHYQSLVQTGGVEVVKSEQECIKAIKMYLTDPSLHKEGRKKITDTVTGVPDGKAGIRLSNDILDLTTKVPLKNTKFAKGQKVKNIS